MRKIIKSANSDAAQAFRLHYFPNIPVGGAPAPDGGSADGGFRSLVPAAGDAAPAGPPAGGPPAGEGALGPAEIERQAYNEGFARGERDAREALRRQMEPVLASLQQLLEGLEGCKQKLRREAEQEIVGLALAVARKIVNHELRTDAAALTAVVRAALGRTEAAGAIQVRLHPDDLRRLQEAHGDLAAVLAGGEQVRFEADPALTGGGCLVETAFGQIDARVEEQFRAVEEAFRAEMMLSGEGGDPSP